MPLLDHPSLAPNVNLFLELLCAGRRAEFKECGRLGSGSFAQVVAVKHRLDGLEYAIKRSSNPIVDAAAKYKWLQVRRPPNVAAAGL